MYKKTVSVLSLDKNQKLLDIGYGNGYLLKLADKSFSCNLQFVDNSLDAVSSINTVYFWSDTVKGLSEIRRCLVPGRCFINAVYTKEWLSRTKMAEKGFKKFEPEELVELGKQAGFGNIEIAEIVKGKSFFEVL